MSVIRPFSACDLLDANPVNLDPYTENFAIGYYMRYKLSWPTLFLATEAATTDIATPGTAASLGNDSRGPRGPLMGYVMGKTEGKDTLWHGHVSAITVGPQFRRLGLARLLMDYLEESSAREKCYFVDLFVRPDNAPALQMYERLGYIVYRVIDEYYRGSSSPTARDDAYDMRKPLPRDALRDSVRLPPGYNDGRDVHVDIEATIF